MVRLAFVFLIPFFYACNGKVVNSNSKYKSLLGSESSSGNYTKVRDIMMAKCAACHTSQNAPDLPASSEMALNGRYVVPGDPESSILYQRLLASEPQRMPPAKALASEQIEAVRKWIVEMEADGSKKGGGTSNPISPPAPGETPSSPEFEAFMGVILKRCIWCHDDNDSYQGTSSFRLEAQDLWIEKGLVIGKNFEDSIILSKIKGAGVTPSDENMPLDLPSLSVAEIDIVKTWINSFEGGTGGGGGNGGSTAEGRYIAAKGIIDRRCQSCHSGGSARAGFRVDYNSEQDFIDNGLVEPRNPAGSIVFSVIRGAGVGGEEDMPTNGSLSTNEINTIRTWIQQIR